MKYRYKIFGVFLLACSIQAGLKTDASAADIMKIKQTACDMNAATVTWDTVDGADFYKCTLTDGKNSNFSIDVNTTEGTFTGLSAGSSYQLSILAYKGDEILAESSESYEVVTTPDITNYKVEQTNAGEKNVTLSLQGATGANYYIVKKNGENIAAAASKKSSKTLKVKGLKANKEYTFKVYAVRKSAGDFYAYNKKSYKKITVKTINEKIPVEKFDIKSMDFSNDKYTFGVDGSSYLADGYELQLRSMAGEEKKLLTGTNFKNVLVEDMIKGHFYKYRVRTFIKCSDQNAYSKWSEDKYIGVGEDAFGVISLKKIKITWKKVTDATGYEVSVSSDGKSYRTLKTVSASSARKVVLTRVWGYRIRLNKRYYFRIRPISKDGNNTIKSEYTNDVSVILQTK